MVKNGLIELLHGDETDEHHTETAFSPYTCVHLTVCEHEGVQMYMSEFCLCVCVSALSASKLCILGKVLKMPNEEESCLFQVTGAHTHRSQTTEEALYVFSSAPLLEAGNYFR